MAKRTLIQDLRPNQLVEGVFAIQNCQLGLTRNGKPFLKCLLADRSGRLPGRMWNASEQMANTLPTDGFVFFEGQTQPYQGELQIIIQSIRPVANPSPEDLRDLLPCSDERPDDMFAQVVQVLDTLEHPALRALAQRYLEDEEMMERFRYAPAAMSLHHACLSGLLEHTRNLLRLGTVVCPLYPQLNRDLVLMGLFLHDLGKCAELCWETGFGYTDGGHLVGHIAQGVLWLQRKAEDCAALGHPLPPAVLNVLHHIILSHHGRPEYGALKLPATPEAILVSLLDNLDAKTYMAIDATRNADGSDKKPEVDGYFTEKVWALETRLFRPDPTRLH